MLVIQNRKIKKGIEIPEIEISIAVDENSVTFGSIDKVKYADWLSLIAGGYNTHCGFSKTDESKYLKSAMYLGDELTVTGDENEDLIFFFNIKYNISGEN